MAYNLMKLERYVFNWTADTRWMDAYERALFNCRLGTQNTQGLKQYFFPLGAGYWRAYNSPEESFWCCTGTGAEEFAKFTDTIYFRRGRDLYVNQFTPSTLDWKEEGFVLEQITQFPHEQGTTLKIKSSRPASPMRVVHGRTTEPKDLPAPAPLRQVTAAPDANTSQWIKVESAPELRFNATCESAKYQLMPMYQIGDQRYSVYWQMQRPKQQS